MKIDDCINLEDLRVLAKNRIPKIVYDFVEGGVDDEDGLTTNRNAFARHALAPRYMAGLIEINQSTTLFGKTYSSCYGIGPTGGIGNFRRGGDMMLAAAARDANIPFVMSGASTGRMEDLAATAPDHGWYQLYTAKDRAISEDQIKRADDLGLQALMITVDVPVTPNRERNRRNGFGRPLRLSLASKLDALRRPLWMKDYARYGIAMMENWQKYAPAGATAEEVGEFVATQVPTSVSWRDIENFRKLWSGPLVLKGVLRADDALRAADIGVDGLVVSNHGARQLDRAPSALDVLPHLNAAVGERMVLMIDGGFRRGSDIVIAKALGAKFVWLGRPTLYGVIAGGDAGAAKAVQIVQNEIKLIMTQIGCPALDDLGPDYLFDANSMGRNAPQ